MSKKDKTPSCHESEVCKDIFTSKMRQSRTWDERLADFFTDSFGTILFLNGNLFFFAVWIFWNLGIIPWLPIFDPSPFVLLITIVSLEAITLSTIVLISQRRAAKIADIRSEVDLQVNIQAEKQIAKVLDELKEMQDRMQGVFPKDPDLERLKEPLNVERLEKEVTKSL
jgi:uncharacterized membrane protein